MIKQASHRPSGKEVAGGEGVGGDEMSWMRVEDRGFEVVIEMDAGDSVPFCDG